MSSVSYGSKNLVIDNGSYEIKMGYMGEKLPITVPNCIVRSKDRKVYIGDQLNYLSDVSQVQIRRPFEKGQLTSWELEKHIWDYSLVEKLRVNNDLGNFNDTNLILTETPFSLPQLSKNCDQIVFEEYNFNSYYRTPVASLIPWNIKSNRLLLNDDGPIDKPYDDFQLIVDSGFNCTWVIPVIYGVVYWKGVKKLAIGGRLLSGYLRELISFRYYDVTDETLLVNNIKEKSCFVAQDYNQTISDMINLKNSKKNTDSNLMVEYVLPDFKTTTTGYILTKEMKKQKTASELENLLVLKLYDERISTPELLIHPEIAQLKKKGLTSTIIDSIQSSPELARPLLAANIILIGGNFKIPGFKERILKNLKENLPDFYNTRIGLDKEKCTTYGWESGCKLFENKDIGFNKVCITKEEYLEHGVNWCAKRFNFNY
ncbi:hypothetical protein PACTADRAFT_51258 [Pachysolen tannophilus NRRL Y-2460]|uniref:Actin-like protein ARP6 n=1 Tax=Pachysolen tannophilus NRRL Y-2460 TaxID=669874 RepID=A0A1E4TRQ7_PACTA|nr:hypothetical protein PACTADRAFT_51258 [Pachysolen tannophilus NRRL Y-2460]